LVLTPPGLVALFCGLLGLGPDEESLEPELVPELAPEPVLYWSPVPPLLLSQPARASPAAAKTINVSFFIIYSYSVNDRP